MKMFWHNLILSDQYRYRIPRHLLFWVARLVFVECMMLQNHFMMNTERSVNWLMTGEPLTTIRIGLVKVFLEALLCYAGIYWLLPKYLVKGRYWAFGLGLALTSSLNNSLFNLFLFWFLPTVQHSYPGFWQLTYSIFSNFITWIGLPTCLSLMAYKMIKAWYHKEEEKKLLTIENTKAELQLLKAQVHPHFLFNTLNNIYSFTLDRSPMAGELVAKLSHIIRYMTKECDQALVPLCNEIKILKDYMSLEKVRYGSQLDLQMKINGDHENKFITPLLMIPFVENSFKHGTSRMLEHPWIKLDIQINELQVFFHLSNSKPPPSLSTNGKHGMGLKNVRRRLEILYPKAHTLEVKSEADTFSVQMVVALEKFPQSIGSANLPMSKPISNQTPTYART